MPALQPQALCGRCRARLAFHISSTEWNNTGQSCFLVLNVDQGGTLYIILRKKDTVPKWAMFLIKSMNFIEAFFLITCATYRSRKAILSHQFIVAKWCRIGRLLPWMAHFNLVINFKAPRGENRWRMFGESYHKYCFPFKFLIDHRLPWIWGFAYQIFLSDVLSFEALLIMHVVACSNTQSPWV